MHHPRFHTIVVLATLLAGCLPGAVLPARAQETPAGQASANANLPDAIVLVQPFGDQASLAVTYSRVVPHAAARESLQRLARLAGWKITTPAARDEELFDYSDAGKKRSLGRQTGVEAEATAGVSSLTFGAAFRLQPFVEAYRDLNRFDIFIMTGALQNFSGLRSFNSPALTVTLEQDRGPYRYRVEVRDHQNPVPKLPLDEPVAAGVQPGAAVRGTTEGRPLPIWPVLVIALCAGVAVFASLRLLAAVHTRRPATSLVRGGRPLRSGPMVVSPRQHSHQSRKD